METEPKIVQTYIATGKARLVYRHLLQLGEGSLRTAEASECAADQGAFWPMHDLLYQRQSAVSRGDLEATLEGFARDLRLDVDSFATCMKSHKHVDAIRADDRAAQAAGVRYRPTFDINGARLTGSLPFETFQKQIDGAAKR